MNVMNIRCDYCGRFISYKDFTEKKAECHMVTPESDISREKFESYHLSCREKNRLRILKKVYSKETF